jgi:chondroitin 4-sulfotransferase 11
MIISHRLKYAFIHIPKTGGTSINNLFLNNPIFKYDLVGHWEQMTPEDYAKHNVSQHLYIHANIQDVNNFLVTQQKIPDDYFKFAFIRNPWNREVSRYEYYKQYMSKVKHRLTDLEKYNVSMAEKSFEDFVKNTGDPEYCLSFIFIQDTLSLNFIGKFENMQNDLTTIIKNICPSIKENQWTLPHLNKTIRKPYQEYFTKKTRDIIKDRHSKIIELGQYLFD